MVVSLDVRRAQRSTTQDGVSSAAASPLGYEQRDALVLQANTDHDLRPLARQVLTVLALKYYNTARGDAFPSQAALAEDAGATVPRVSDALRELEARGYLVAERRRGRHFRSRLYRLARPREDESQLPPRANDTAPQLLHRASDAVPTESHLPHRASESLAPQSKPHCNPVKPENPESGDTGVAPVVGGARSPASSSPRGTRLSPDWRPTEAMVTTAMSKHEMTRAEVDRLTENFVNHWPNETGPNAVKLRWGGAWCNWIAGHAKGEKWELPRFKTARGAATTNTGRPVALPASRFTVTAPKGPR